MRQGSSSPVDQHADLLVDIEQRLGAIERVGHVHLDNRAFTSLGAGRNLIDNGQRSVNQRAATSVAMGTAGTNVRAADRWAAANAGVGATTLGWAAWAGFGVALPAGRPNPGYMQYILIATGEAAGSLSASDILQEFTAIEGVNLQHLNWGTAAARPVTVSFDCYSNIGGTYVAELISRTATTRTISKLFTVASGFHTVTLTFPGDTFVALPADAADRLDLNIMYAAGSTYTSSPLQTAWGTYTVAARCAGVSNTIQATTGNIVGITNVQMEVGSYATPYEVRSFDAEQRSAMRYFRRTAIGASYGEGAVYGYSTAGNSVGSTWAFPVPMRAAPSGTLSAGWTFTNCATLNLVPTGGGCFAYVVPTATGPVNAYSGTTGYIDFAAEI